MVATMRIRANRPAEHLTLAELRSRLGLTQERLGLVIETSQPAVKKMEGSHDPLVSTVRRFVEALGEATGKTARFELHATIDKENYVIELAQARPVPAEPTGAARDSSLAPSASRAWRLRAWDDSELEQTMANGGFIAMSADEIGDLTIEPSRDQLRSRLREAPVFASRGDQAIGMFVNYWEIFRTRMQVGDIVAVPLTDRQVGIAEITGDYAYRADEPDPRLRHVRPVRWLTVGTSRRELPDDLRRVVNAPGTVCSLKSTDAADRLRGMASSS
jgi:transcriptional regulator with XRE-family HTH domain